ncbi:hypothetical protein [Actinoplanes sp. NPDC051411]|uniref:hypothetical protein n=1 Tax=Actinoplanes sp. NPDC051411 TaxID=3155522 RepID=UPI003415172C
MAAGPGAYKSPEEIAAAAKNVVEAAVKMRGERELRFVPEGPGPDRWAAGANSADRSIVAGKYGGYAVDANGYYLGTDADWAKVRAAYAWIPGLFSGRVDPDPIRFQPLIDGMEQTALTIHDDDHSVGTSPVAQYVDDVSHLTADWKGPAADLFQANFIGRLKTAAKNQAYIAGVMMHAMIAERDIFVAVRNDLVSTAGDTVKAIEAIDEKSSGGLKTFLTVAAAVTALVAGIASIPTTGGLLLPAAIQADLWIISGASATLGLATFPDHNGLKLAAPTVDGVLSNMIDSLTRIDGYITTHESDVKRCLDRCTSVLTGPERDLLLLPPQPGMVSDTDAELRTDFMPP